MVHVRKSPSHPEWVILCSAEITKAIIDPHPANQILAETHRLTKDHGTKMQFPCKFWAPLQNDFHIWCDCNSKSLFLFLTFWFIYRFIPVFSLSLHLSVSSSWVVLMQVLCIDQNVWARGCFTPCSCRLIYSCDILSFFLIQLSALQGYRCFR